MSPLIKMWVVAFAICTVVGTRTGFAQPEEGAGIVTMELLADHGAIAEGQKVTLGVRFKIKPEWHIYWVNPGESGYETKVDWSGAGIGTVGSTLYPAPVKFVSPGPLTSYGYANEVLLMGEVVVKLPQPTPKEVEIKVKAKWLMCADRCIPGKAEASLKLPVAAAGAADTKPAPANAELFAKYRALLPRADIGPEVKAASEKAEKGFVTRITVTPQDGMAIAAGESTKARMAYFFPMKVEGYELGVPMVPAADGKATVGGAEIPVYRKPFVISMTSEAFDAKVSTPPAVQGVLVTQGIDQNGTVQNVAVKAFGAKTP